MYKHNLNRRIITLMVKVNVRITVTLEGLQARIAKKEITVRAGCQLL